MPADALSRVFSALADPTRRDMVARLAVADATVNELAEPYDVSLQAVSKHLRVLEDAGLVSRTREAQRRPVHLEAEVFDLMTKWIERYRQQAEERYRRLDDVLRDLPDDVDPIPPQTGEQAMSTTTHHDTEIIVDPDVPLIRLVREFDAPPEKVFRAHTDPDLLVQWLGPRDLEMEVLTFDCRTGGEYRYVHRRDGEEYFFHGCFHEVRPSEVIVQTFTFEGMPDSRRPREDDARAARRRPHAASSPRRSATASRTATPWSPAAWRPASSRATRSSTTSSPPASDQPLKYASWRRRPGRSSRCSARRA